MFDATAYMECHIIYEQALSTLGTERAPPPSPPPPPPPPPPFHFTGDHTNHIPLKALTVSVHLSCQYAGTTLQEWQGVRHSGG